MSTGICWEGERREAFSELGFDVRGVPMCINRFGGQILNGRAAMKAVMESSRWFNGFLC